MLLFVLFVSLVWVTRRVTKAIFGPEVAITQTVSVNLSAFGLFKNSRAFLETSDSQDKQKILELEGKLMALKKRADLAERALAPTAQQLTPPRGTSPSITAMDETPVLEANIGAASPRLFCPSPVLVGASAPVAVFDPDDVARN